MADELGRPPDGLDAANLKALEAARAKGAQQKGKPPTPTPLNPAAVALGTGARSADQSAWQKTSYEQALAAEAAARTPEPPPIPLTDAEKAEYEAALQKVRELQGRAYGGALPPVGAPALQVLRKWRVRLDGVTAAGTPGGKILARYLRKLRKYAHPLTGSITEFPDGADVVEAYSPGEAWDLFRGRFAIQQSSHMPTIVELGGPEDLAALEREENQAILDPLSGIKVPA
jgi:hypothetical protein